MIWFAVESIIVLVLLVIIVWWARPGKREGDE